MAVGDDGSHGGGVRTERADDDGLDALRRDLVDLVLREVGGRVAAEPDSPVARLLTGIVRREMATAVDILRREEAARDTPIGDRDIAFAGDLASNSGARSGPNTGSNIASSRARDALLIGIGIVAALLLFGAGFFSAGMLARPAGGSAQPALAGAPAADISLSTAMPAATAAAATAPAPAPATSPAVDGSTGMATQLRERPR